MLKEIKGWYMPQWDNHYEPMMKQYGDKWEYQKDTRDYSLGYVKRNRVAIDVGANIGFWAIDLHTKFQSVWCFEPHPENKNAFQQNFLKQTGAQNPSNIFFQEYAVSKEKHQEKLKFYCSPDECGNASLSSHGVETGNSKRTLKSEQLSTYDVEVTCLDHYFDEFKDQHIDYIKVDVQGHELEVMQGAVKLLHAHDPVLCLELPQRNPEEVNYHNEVVNLLSSLGYNRRGNMRKETIFTKWK